MLTKDFVAWVPVCYLFTAAHFYLAGCSLLTASISHFLTTDIKFSCSFSNKIRLLWFFLYLFPCYPRQCRKKTRLCCCIFSLKVRVATRFRAKNLELPLGCHTCWLSYSIMVYLRCGRTRGGRVDVRSRDYEKFLGCIDWKYSFMNYVDCTQSKREIKGWWRKKKRKE